jgi:prevent-host-death family protein
MQASVWFTTAARRDLTRWLCWLLWPGMGLEKASVAEAKNTLSSLINKVAYGKTRVVLESRGKPKAALVSTGDLEQLERLEQGVKAPLPRLYVLARAQGLRRRIRSRRKKTLPDSAELLNRLRDERDRGR